MMMKIWYLSHWLYLRKIPIIPGLLTRFIRVIFSCEIPPSARIAKKVVFSHNGLGCVVNEDAVIKRGTKILQNVTIGGRGSHGVPYIGENVLIGCGAAVIGGVKIGKNAKIGANAVVICDIPEGATAVGVPAKIR